jgi:hypothetical protein
LRWARHHNDLLGFAPPLGAVELESHRSLRRRHCSHLL